MEEARMGQVAERRHKLGETRPAMRRDNCRQRVVVGGSAEETAEAVGSTPGAVRVAQHRALGRLRSGRASEGVV